MVDAKYANFANCWYKDTYEIQSKKHKGYLHALGIKKGEFGVLESCNKVATIII